MLCRNKAHYVECHAECRNAECPNAECHYTKWHYAEYRNAYCHYAECRRAISEYIEKKIIMNSQRLPIDTCPGKSSLYYSQRLSPYIMVYSLRF